MPYPHVIQLEKVDHRAQRFVGPAEAPAAKPARRGRRRSARPEAVAKDQLQRYDPSRVLDRFARRLRSASLD